MAAIEIGYKNLLRWNGPRTIRSAYMTCREIVNSYLTRLDDSWIRKGKMGVGIAYRDKCICRAQQVAAEKTTVSRQADDEIDGTQRTHEPDRSVL
jgi:hypothetical protein